MNKLYYTLLVIATLIFTGCSSKGGEKPQTPQIPPVGISPTLTDDQLRAGGGGLYGNSGDASGGVAGGETTVGAPTARVVYFDFDRFEVRGDARPVIEEHAAFLTRNPNIPVRLEGHADERGSREYNLALGEKRANSVRDTLMLLGVNPQQLNILSYGEERPANQGHNEMAWQSNRRVEFIYP